MAEAAGSLLEYREPPTLDSDGEATKPPPRRCLSVRKQRKGIPMKVPERLITEDEDSLRRHRCVFCGRRFRKIARHLQRAHAGETRGAPGRARGSRDWVLRDRGDARTPPPPPPECGPCWSGPAPPGRHQKSGSRQRGTLYTAREEEQPQQEEERPAAGRRSVKEGGQGEDRQTSSSLQQRQERARQALLDPQQRLSTGLAETWRSLCHSSLALLILFNRRRDCEVSKLRVSSYCQRRRVESEATEERQALMGQELSLLDRERPLCDRSRRKVLGVSAAAAPPAGREEDLALEAALSPFEREVLCDLTRAKVQGKRGKLVPLLLTAEMESSLDLLLSTRDQVGVSPENPYVFARPFHSAATPLRGGDLLRLLARSCGARRPQSLTCTRLRRQVAILSQLLSLCGRAQRSRLEGYLRREYHVTQDCTRLQEDPGLMGRVARVVLAGEKDGLMFKGMTLEQICLELDVLSENSADALSEDEQEQEEEEEEVTRKQKRASSSSSQKPLPSPALPQSQQRQRRPPRAPPSLQMTSPSPSPSPSARNSNKRSGAQPRQGAVMGEDVITQVPGLVTGTEGQSVTLNCTEHATGLGAVRWSRDTGGGRQPFFSTGGDIRNPRVSFILENHLTDRSIRIDNLTLGDSGVYYCDKYRTDPSRGIAIPGPGVTLTVTVRLHSPELQGPSAGRVVVPGSITLNCSVTGPQGTVLSWRKNSDRIKEEPKGQLSSVLTLDITAEDIRNNITFAPLPKISKAASVNHTVTLTCSVQGYYPMNISITWSHQGGAAELKDNPLHDGTFSAERNLSLTLQEKDRLTVNCTAEVLGLNSPKMTQFVLDTQESSSTDSPSESETQPSVIVVSVVTVGVILVLLVAMVVWRCSHHQKTVGGKQPEGTARGTGVTPEEVTYAGLDQSRLNQGRRKRKDDATQYQETEYASVNIRK
ncbi:SHPS1 phosphatase, partial [Atractosteus spatula]|nr:SHPS1 phosphatase [Atractosteus spatula]